MFREINQIGVWPARRWVAAVAAGVLAALAIGIPTGIVDTPFYTRMTPVTWWDYPVWAASAALVALTAATYVRAYESGSRTSATRTIGGGVLAAFAVGCPICNKLVVALVGVSGALDYWAPLQPLLGLLSIAVLALALRVRLRAERECALALR